MNIERLQLLVTLLEEIRDTPKPDVLFNLGMWAVGVNYTPADVQILGIFGNRPETLKEGFCGTVACAVGHACLDERFNAQGLVLCNGKEPAYGVHRAWAAVQEFFGLSLLRATDLFAATRYPKGSDTDVQAVIDRLVTLLTGAENSEQEHSPCP